MQSDDGQVLIIIVLFMIVLLGFCALCLDVGHAYLAQRRLQSAADAAALAGAQELPDVTSATTFANTYGSNGNNAPSGLDSSSMTVTTRCIASVPGCAPSNAVVVKETGVINTTFAKLLGVPTITVHASATACSPCGEKPLDVMLVLDRTGSMCTNSAGKPDPACTDMENARDGHEDVPRPDEPALDHVGLAVLPPASSMATKCDKPPNTASYDDPNAPYVLVPLSSDYKTGTDLNTASNLVSTINCVQANGNTAYANAIDAAQAEIVKDGRPGTIEDHRAPLRRRGEHRPALLPGKLAVPADAVPSGHHVLAGRACCRNVGLLDRLRRRPRHLPEGDQGAAGQPDG